MATRAESYSLDGPGVSQFRSVKDLGLGKEELGLGSLVQAAGRRTLLPAAALVSTVTVQNKRYSSLSLLLPDRLFSGLGLSLG